MIKFLLKNIVEQSSTEQKGIPYLAMEYAQGYIDYIRAGVKDLMWIIIILLAVIIFFLGLIIFKRNGNNN